MLMGGGLHAAPQPIGCGVPSADMTVRGFAARLPKMEVLSRALPRRISTASSPAEPSATDATLARPPLRASMVVCALPRADGHRTCGSPAREADEQLERGHVSMREIR